MYWLYFTRFDGRLICSGFFGYHHAIRIARNLVKGGVAVARVVWFPVNAQPGTSARSVVRFYRVADRRYWKGGYAVEWGSARR